MRAHQVVFDKQHHEGSLSPGHRHAYRICNLNTMYPVFYTYCKKYIGFFSFFYSTSNTRCLHWTEQTRNVIYNVLKLLIRYYIGVLFAIIMDFRILIFLSPVILLSHLPGRWLFWDKYKFDNRRNIVKQVIKNVTYTCYVSNY